MSKTDDQLQAELRDLKKDIKDNPVEVDPTDEEIANGWTKTKLEEYLTERKVANSAAIDPDSLHRRVGSRPNEANHRYSPLRWRG